MSTPQAELFHFEKVEWDDPTSGLDPNATGTRELVRRRARGRAAQEDRARRVRLLHEPLGDARELPRAPHHHDHDELLVVLSGGCSFDDGLAELGPGDSIVIRANTHYGFTCGGDGNGFPDHPYG
jgi:mannose-6-phosphate isomerase-like protein (cupin superfamily)